jgi:SAM-dependent methyltransferase
LRTGGGVVVKAWYEEAFGDLYPVLYAHRDEEEAGAIARLVASRRPLGALRLLDVATGSGRVARALTSAGASVVGLDLSQHLLDEARRRRPAVQLVRADMRNIPLRDASFDGALLIFTSFGYFATDGENFRVLDEMARTLRPGGFLMLDLPNGAWIRRNLVPRSERAAGRLRIVEERRFEKNGERLVKNVTVSDPGEGWTRRWKEDVRVYEPARIRDELGRRALVGRVLWGDYDGAAFDEERPRMIVWAERSSAGKLPGRLEP